MRLERWLYTLPLRFRSLFQRRRVDQELDDELRFHLEQKTREYVAGGMTPQDASHAAFLELGGVDQTKNQCRHVRKVNWILDLIQDLGYAGRMLRKDPGFAIVAVLTLAIGIGANTAIFNVLYGVLLKPLVYPEQNRVVTIWHSWRSGGFNRLGLSAPQVQLLQAGGKSFTDFGVYRPNRVFITPGQEPEQVICVTATSGVLESLGLRPILGRRFQREDELAGSPPVAILTYELWHRWFHGDPGIVGRSVRINSRLVTVIGVLPAASFVPEDLTGSDHAQLWLPLAVDPKALGFNFDAVARLKPGVRLDRAKAEVQAVFYGQDKAQLDPGENEWKLHVTAVQDDVVSSVRKPLWILAGAAGVVLLIVCANVATLLLSRAAVRQKEMAVRAALGARRGRIVRQLLAESLLLALLSGTAGVGLATLSLKTVVLMAGNYLPRAGDVRISLSVMLFAASASLLTTFLFGLAPAMQTARAAAVDALNAEARGTVGSLSRSRLRRLLVVGEVAAAMVLVISAGLLLRSFHHLMQVNPGFQPGRLFTAQIELPRAHYQNDAAISSYCRRLLDPVQSLPGVVSAAFTSAPPLTGISGDSGFEIPDRPGEVPGRFFLWQVSGDFFKTMGIAVTQGRGFEERDHAGAPVMVINENARKSYWPQENPIGKHIRLRWGGAEDHGAWAEIIGVAANVAIDDLQQEPQPQAYMPLAQSSRIFLGTMGTTLVVRTASDPAGLAGAIRGQAHDLDPEAVVREVRTGEQLVADTVLQPRFNLALLEAFGGVALFLAAVGIYGTLSNLVRQRTREIGIRMALGAKRGHVGRLVVTEGMQLALLGLLIGSGIALAATRVLRSLLYRIQPADPLTFVAVALLLVIVAILAGYVPARRAMRVDPMVALRSQ